MTSSSIPKNVNVSAVFTTLRIVTSSLPQAFEQRVIQPAASIHGYYGFPDHKHAANAHTWSAPTAFSATMAQHTALRPVSKQRRTSLLVYAAVSHYAALQHSDSLEHTQHHPDSLGHHRTQFRLTVNYAASSSDSLEHSTGPANISRWTHLKMDDSTCYRPPVSEGSDVATSTQPHRNYLLTAPSIGIMGKITEES